MHDRVCSAIHLPVVQLGTAMQRLFEAAGHFVPSGMKGVESCRSSLTSRMVLCAAGLRSMEVAKTALEVEFFFVFVDNGR